MQLSVKKPRQASLELLRTGDQMICRQSSFCRCHPITPCFTKIQTGLTFPVPAYPGCPGKEAVKWVSVCLSRKQKDKVAVVTLAVKSPTKSSVFQWWSRADDWSQGTVSWPMARQHMDVTSSWRSWICIDDVSTHTNTHTLVSRETCHKLKCKLHCVSKKFPPLNCL